MSRRIVALLLTAGVIGVVVGVGARRPSAGPSSTAVGTSATPEDRLRSLIDAARSGDVDAYLDAYAEPLRSRVAREADEKGRPAFADDLRRASSSRKGFAIHAPQADGPDAVRVELESVYADRNVRQAYRLRRVGDAWRIAEVEPARGREPSARYGTSANFQEPEGVPVPGAQPSESSEYPGP